MPPSEEKFLLKDHLFNATTVGEMAAWFGLGSDWVARVTAGFPERELKARIEWISDCLELELPSKFRDLSDHIEVSLPPPLDPTKTDDDFGHFIIAPLGVLATRHGMDSPERALDLIEALTQRFSMEFAVRPFINDHQALTLARLEAWCDHPNYHVRRLVSEGTRARLPWAPKIALDPMRPLDLLDRLHADPTRYVTRSVANHIGDIAKIDLTRAVAQLEAWRSAARQDADELDWMIRHALRTQIKAGAAEAMRAIGVVPDAPVADARITVTPGEIAIGDSAQIQVSFTPETDGVLVVDYQITFANPKGAPRQKMFKLKQVQAKAGEAVQLGKAHRFKGNATTFSIYPGAHEATVFVNGTPRATARFMLERLQ
jgi:3-methyladenine DNA glycosylase AlkC